ncbi:MAG: IS1 family transposase, partial [Pseudanabaena sp.]
KLSYLLISGLPCLCIGNRHRPVGKETGHTAYIERLNCTLRQRAGRLVRKTLSFSKNIENHIGAIFFFARHYNSSLPLYHYLTCYLGLL